MRAGGPQLSFLPQDTKSFSAMLEVFILEKALYELSYELDNRPSWVGIPLRGLAELLAA